MELLLDVRGVVKEYESVQALKGVDLQVHTGEVVALLGPNGSGKSTLLKVAAGLVHPTEGEVRVAGAPAGSVAAKRAIGYLPQRVAFFEGMRVAEALELFCRLRQIPAERAAEALESVGMLHAAHRPIHELSGGMVQRVGLAAAILGEPALLLLDEPGLNLDREGLQRLAGFVERWQAAGRGVLFSSHQVQELAGLAHRIVELREGRIVGEWRVQGPADGPSSVLPAPAGPREGPAPETRVPERVCCGGGGR
ncbi:ABC transporter ATP-binding protein [Limnochorda sp.]|uniref:ABC transporter ATP-binding protein n=1 Tax=Limnochorda sp. TaxID=1940279 RepID=UPI0039C23F16